MAALASLASTASLGPSVPALTMALLASGKTVTVNVELEAEDEEEVDVDVTSLLLLLTILAKLSSSDGQELLSWAKCPRG